MASKLVASEEPVSEEVSKVTPGLGFPQPARVAGMLPVLVLSSNEQQLETLLYKPLRRLAYDVY